MLDRLQRAAQALASPAEVQLGLYPAFVARPDELALDYGEALARAVTTPEWEHRVRGPGRELLLKLDDYLTQMSVPSRRHVWTEQGLRDAPEWAAIRATAAAALTLLNWPPGPPPRSPDIFVPAV
jgi:hypothetical protein